MIKMFINDEEVVSNKELTIKEEMLATPSTILNNCYPKAWENVKDYVSKFYYPKDYSRCIIAKGFEKGEDRWLTYNESGSNINFDTNISLPFKNITIDGKSTQATRSGKNLFDISKVITNWNNSINTGIKNNNDGTLTISSPPTSTTSIALSPNTLKDYCPNLQVGDVVYLNATTTGTNKYIYLDVSASLWNFGTKRTITQNDLDSKVYWYASGVNTTATISDIMISTDGGEYEPYGVMPSPDYPSEIESVKGKNLFDINGNRIDYNATSSIINDTLKIITSGNYARADYLNIEIPKTAHTISFNWESDTSLSGTDARIYVYDGATVGTMLTYSNLVGVSGKVSLTFTNTTGVISIRFSPNNTATSKTITMMLTNIQLEKGTVATDYLPYNTIQVKDVGKNLFNKDNVKRIYAYIQNNTTWRYYNDSYSIRIPVKPNANYVISADNPNETIFRAGVTDSSDIPVLGTNVALYSTTRYSNTNTPIYITTGANAKYIVNQVAENSANDTFNTLQLEEGTVATTYEPYQENILNINLQGNELCSLPNNVKDELVIENGRAKIIKRIGRIVYDGSESGWGYQQNWSSIGDSSNAFYIIKPVNMKDNSDICPLISNRFVRAKVSDITIKDLVGLIAYSQNVIVRVPKSINSVSDLKGWLSNNNVIVYYILSTPIEIDLGEVETLSTFKGVNNVSLDTNIQTNMSLTYLYKNYELIFCGIVKNSGNISLNPRYPHFCDLQILDFKNFLSESDMLDFVISNKTVVEAINMVIEAIKDYGFILGNVNIFGADDIIKAYSTQNKTAYDVFQYLADITSSRWYTRTIDEETVAIDFYDPTLMPSGMNIEYNVDWFEENQIVDLQFNYGSRDYRNKQVMMSNEVFGNINYNETLISNGYETSYLLLNNIGEIVSITINGEEKTFVTNELHDIGFEADFYYTPNKNQLESEDTYPIGTQIVVKYIPIIEGRQVVYNYDEIMRINNQTGRKGIIARYETRNDTTSSKELEKIGETYIKYKGTSEINLLLTSEKDLYNIGQIVYFDSPINELTQSYMVKTKEIKIIAVADFQKVIYYYELTSSFNSEKEINYFDNQRSKNKGNIEEGETITRNIDIENSTEILFNNLSISEVTPTGDNILDCILESPFID